MLIPDMSADGYERILAARISEDRNLHRKIHEHKRRIEAQRLKGNGLKVCKTGFVCAGEVYGVSKWQLDEGG